jgi:protein-S-isoprenylcysteine O-methyltransferase Ste14
MKLTITKHGAVFALILIVALFAYLYITSPMLEFIKVFGCSLSLLLFLIAMQARLRKHIDTKQLGADWALLFVGACGLSFFVFFWDLSAGYVSNKAWWALIIGVLFHVIGLACWYGQNLLNKKRKTAN